MIKAVPKKCHGIETMEQLTPPAAGTYECVA